MLALLVKLKAVLDLSYIQTTSETRRDMIGRFSSAKGQIRSNKKRESRKS